MEHVIRRFKLMKFKIFLLLGLLLFTTKAMALDAYQDRKGMYGGIHLGGGGVFDANEGDAAFVGGFDIGAGMNRSFLLGADVELWYSPQSGDDLFVIRPGVQMHYFITENFFIRTTLGVGWYKQGDFSKASFAFGGGPGFEFFVGANMALGFGVYYEHHLIGDLPDLNLVSFGLEFRWY